ncbi:MAG: carbon-nitrogen hydrolase, partial [bacterium]
MKKIAITLSLFLVLFGGYSFWRHAGRTVDGPGSGLFLQEIAEFGVAGGLGNLVGIQPYMLPVDYASEEHFFRKITGYFDAAEKKGWLHKNTIVVLPEYLGAWLVAAGEKRAVYQAANIEAAMQTMVLSNLFSFLKTLPFAKGKDVIKDSVFRMKAASMAQIYHNVFSRLAQQYAVTIVAGSIVLPAPRIREGQLTVGDRELYNVSVVYRSDGTPYQRLVKKVFPINDELPFTARSAADSLPVFETPAGKLGVLICAD